MIMVLDVFKLSAVIKKQNQNLEFWGNEGMTQTCVSLAPPPWVQNSVLWGISQQPEESWTKGKAVWGNHQINKNVKKKKARAQLPGCYGSAQSHTLGASGPGCNGCWAVSSPSRGNSRLPTWRLTVFPLVSGSLPVSSDPRLLDTEKAPSYYFSWISPSSSLTLHVWFS